jgi:hypothetical protein
MATIKEINGKTIAVLDSSIPHKYSLSLPLLVGGVGITAGLLISYLNLWSMFIFVMGGSLGAVGIFALPILWTQPAYCVYIRTAREYDIDIAKTTPEADQIAICKAAQELETKVREIIRNEQGLEAIAARCK